MFNINMSLCLQQEEFVMLTEQEVRRHLYGFDEAAAQATNSQGESGLIDGFADISVHDLEAPLSPAPPSGIDSLEVHAPGGAEGEVAEPSATPSQPPQPLQTPKSRKALIMDLEMPGVLAGEAAVPTSPAGGVMFMVRLYDVGLTCSAGYFNAAAPNPHEIVATSSGKLLTVCPQWCLTLLANL